MDLSCAAWRFLYPANNVHPPRRRQPQTLDPILTMMTSTLTDRRNVIWFIAWMLTGAGYALGILGALSIGP